MEEKFSTEYIKDVYLRNVDDIFGLCFSYLRNIHDCEDAVSAVFEKFINKKPIFETEKNEKAWLVVTACNQCKSMLRYSLRHPKIDISTVQEAEYWDNNENREMLELVMKLPEKYRIVLYLYFYIGYSLAEISKLTNVNESTVRSRLFYGKNKLKKLMGGNDYEKIQRTNGAYNPDAGPEGQNV